MKILHLFDCAASACLIAREQRKQGHDAIVSSYASMDPFGFLDYYGEHRMNVESSQWAQYAMDKLVPDYDIIHVHFMWGLIPHIRSRHPEKKIICHYQGSDARTFPMDLDRKHAESLADAVLYSIGDIAHLMPERAVRFYAPIDSEMFKPVREINYPMDKTLYFLTQPAQHDKDLCMAWLQEQGWRNVTIIDRTHTHTPYAEMPNLLNQFGTYIDIRYQGGKLIDDWSSTAEQCLNLGMEVIDWDGRPHRGLDSKYKSENVLEQLEEVYENL